MLVKIKAAITPDSWYAEIIGNTMRLFDLGNPLYLFADISFGYPVFRMDVEILDNGKKDRKN